MPAAVDTRATGQNNPNDITWSHAMKARHMYLPAALIWALGLVAAPAHAVQNEDLNFDTTEDLYAVCSTTQEQPEHLAATFACRAFIEAAVQYHDAVSDREQMKRLICYPDNATVGDGRRAFLSWVEANKDNAERMGELPVVGLVRALAARYPCP